MVHADEWRVGLCVIAEGRAMRCCLDVFLQQVTVTPDVAFGFTFVMLMVSFVYVHPGVWLGMSPSKKSRNIQKAERS